MSAVERMGRAIGRAGTVWAIGAMYVAGIGLSVFAGTVAAFYIVAALCTLAGRGDDQTVQLWLILSALAWLPLVIGYSLKPLNNFARSLLELLPK